MYLTPEYAEGQQRRVTGFPNSLKENFGVSDVAIVLAAV